MNSHKHIIEYIWFGGNNEFRSKVRVITTRTTNLTLSDIPDWNYDGSSTEQANTSDSEIIIKPVQLYFDKKISKYYVLTETFNNNSPLSNNYRHKYKLLLDKYGSRLTNLDFWFGFEQEFFIYDLINQNYLGFDSSIKGQGPYYCNVEPVISYDYLETKSNITDMRKYTELIFNKCLDLEINTTGWNLEVSPAQTEIQIFGHGIKACDDLIMFRYLCYIYLAPYFMIPIFHPKPLGNKWNGSGLHVNISTSRTREDSKVDFIDMSDDENVRMTPVIQTGYDYILYYLNKFKYKHLEHIKEYGEDNHLRLTGQHETSSMEEFTYGVGSRATSVRIPNEVFKNKKGYFEDRRPAANADPYRIVCRIIETILN
jgi:glutamine synthetase